MRRAGTVAPRCTMAANAMDEPTVVLHADGHACRLADVAVTAPPSQATGFGDLEADAVGDVVRHGEGDVASCWASSSIMIG